MIESDTSKYNLIKKVGDIYITDHKIGAGSFAQVHLGHFQSKEHPVAIKEINKDSLDEFKKKILTREIENMQGMNHKNIISLVNVSQTSSKYYICMELCKNGTLTNYIKDKERTTEFVLKIADDIFEGFRFLYNKSIIHRDIKLDNILIDEKGDVKLADFGFSKTLDEKDKAANGTYLGTPVYACSEVLNQEPYSSKCDVYSVGVVLYEVAFKCHPMFPNKPPSTLKQLFDKFRENPKIEFPAKPAFSENFKNMIIGMLRIKESDRLSWPQVFDMFEKEKLTKANEKQQQQMKVHTDHLEKVLFYDYAANSIQEVLSDCPDRVKLNLHRIRFIILTFFAQALRKVSTDYHKSPQAKLSPEFDDQVKKTIERADSYYVEQFNNNCLLELNQHLKFHEKEPEKNDVDKLNDMLKAKLASVFDMWKNNESMDQPERIKMLLCLDILREHPFDIPDFSKESVEKNMKKSHHDIIKILYK